MSQETSRVIVCEICRNPSPKTGSKQKTCGERACRLALRSKRRKRTLREARKAQPIGCHWCSEPIFEIGKRRYHTECRASRNRERVRDYHRRHPQTVKKPTAKPRHFEGRVVCVVCETEVQRTSARQVTCASNECQYTRKRARETTKRAERYRSGREARLAEIRAEKERRFHSRDPRHKPLPALYRLLSH